jgi:hypothetical protein
MGYHSVNAHAYNAAQALDELAYGETCDKMLLLNNQFTLGLLTREEYVTEMAVLVLATARQ